MPPRSHSLVTAHGFVQALDFAGARLRPKVGDDRASTDLMRRAPLRPGGDASRPAAAWPPGTKQPARITAPDRRAAEKAARAAAGLLPSLDDQIRAFLVDLGYHGSAPPHVDTEGLIAFDEWDYVCPSLPWPELPTEADFHYKALYVEAYEVRGPGLRIRLHPPSRGLAQPPSAKCLGRGYVTGTPANRFWRTDGWQLDHSIPHPPWLPPGPPVPSSEDHVMVEALRRLDATQTPGVAEGTEKTAEGTPSAGWGECLNVTQVGADNGGMAAPSPRGSSDSEYAAGYARGYGDGWDDFEDGDTGANEPATRGDGDAFDEGVFAGYYDAWHDAVESIPAPGSGSAPSSDRESAAGSVPGSGSESSSDRESAAGSVTGSDSECDSEWSDE